MWEQRSTERQGWQYSCWGLGREALGDQKPRDVTRSQIKAWMLPAVKKVKVGATGMVIFIAFTFYHVHWAWHLILAKSRTGNKSKARKGPSRWGSKSQRTSETPPDVTGPWTPSGDAVLQLYILHLTDANFFKAQNPTFFECVDWDLTKIILIGVR